MEYPKFPGYTPFPWIVDSGWFQVDYQVSLTTVGLETGLRWLLLDWPGWPFGSAPYSNPQSTIEPIGKLLTQTLFLEFWKKLFTWRSCGLEVSRL